MSGCHNFSELEAKLSPESRARIKVKVEQLKREIALQKALDADQVTPTAMDDAQTVDQ